MINAKVYWTDDITENFVTASLIKVQTFFAETFSWKVEYGWIDKITKNERKYEWSALYQHKNNPWVRYLFAADVHCHLDCWLGVTVKYRPAGSMQL